MEEMTSNAVTGNDVSADAIHDDWDDIDLSDLQDNEPDVGDGEDADQQTPNAEQETETPADESDKTEAAEEANQLFTLKHLNETRAVGRDEVIALAQKGLDYDRIRESRDQAKAEAARLTELEAFLEELAAPNRMTVDELIDATRANLLAEREGLDQATALQRVKIDRERKALETERNRLTSQTENDKKEAAENARIQDSINRFIKDHPGLDAKDIPREVWDAFAAGKDLADAYAVYEVNTLRKQLEEQKKELEAMKQNQNNMVRSTGSQTTAGARKETDSDLFDKMWYDGT